MQNDTFFVLAVALLSWGGVFAYLLKLEAQVKALEKSAREERRHDEYSAP